MLRRTTLIATLMLFPISAWAKPPAKIDVSNATIVCRTVFGTVKFKPPTMMGGTRSPEKITIMGKLDGCTISGAPSPVTIRPSTFSGKLEGTSNDTNSVLNLNTVTGTLKINWRSDPATPIMQTSSILTPNATCNVGFVPGGAFGATEYVFFHIGTRTDCDSFGAQPAPSVTGAFGGGDGGATSTLDIAASQDGFAVSESPNAGGVKGLNLGLGILALQ